MSSPIRSTWLSTGLGAGTVVISFWPLLRNLPAFRALFFFEDEWDLIDLWDKVGFSAWVSTTFAENFVPLFKLAWGGSIAAFGGSYFALVLLLWLTHAFNVWLVFRVSEHFSGSRLAAAFAGSVFGLAWINYETLTWTVQWSAVLSLSFFLLGVDQIMHWSEGSATSRWRSAGIVALCSAASALCFSRGVLTGLTLAAWVFMTRAHFSNRKQQWAVALAAVAPAVWVAGWIFSHSTGNHHRLGEAAGPMLDFALHYYAQAPLRTLWSNDTPGRIAILLLAGAKTAVVAIAFYCAPQRLRSVLAVLWLFEAGNALLLGLGRYHTGLDASGSSRYQYGALAVFLPACAVIFGQILGWISQRWKLRPLLGSAAVLTAAWMAQSPWTGLMTDWSEWRGGNLRRILFQTPPAEAPDRFTHLPWMSNERARELARKYRLH